MTHDVRMPSASRMLVVPVRLRRGVEPLVAPSLLARVQNLLTVSVKKRADGDAAGSRWSRAERDASYFLVGLPLTGCCSSSSL
jgi:hypothetical protein